jgi:hypothetical protein
MRHAHAVPRTTPILTREQRVKRLNRAYHVQELLSYTVMVVSLVTMGGGIAFILWYGATM